MENPIIEKDGKKVFVGVEDPHNPPVSPHSPFRRYCSKCFKDSDNDKVYCDNCGTEFKDNKMECPTCKRYFDYLLGDDAGGGQRGCEAHWKPPTRKVAYGSEETTSEVFN